VLGRQRCAEAHPDLIAEAVPRPFMLAGAHGPLQYHVNFATPLATRRARLKVAMLPPAACPGAPAVAQGTKAGERNPAKLRAHAIAGSLVTGLQSYCSPLPPLCTSTSTLCCTSSTLRPRKSAISSTEEPNAKPLSELGQVDRATPKFPKPPDWARRQPRSWCSAARGSRRGRLPASGHGRGGGAPTSAHIIRT
jgi:hypothetical protein